MSFLQQVQKISDAHYVLPRIGDMRTDVHAYLSDTLFEQTNEKLWSQAARAAAYPGMIGGYDISCGVVYLRVPGLHASDVADWDKRRAWISTARESVVPATRRAPSSAL